MITFFQNVEKKNEYNFFLFLHLCAKLSAFIILVPNCPPYYLGAKLSGAKLSGAKLSYNPPHSFGYYSGKLFTTTLL